MPRIKSDQERGYIAAWMKHSRVDRGWSGKSMPAHLAEVGYEVDYEYEAKRARLLARL